MLAAVSFMSVIIAMTANRASPLGKKTETFFVWDRHPLNIVKDDKQITFRDTSYLTGDDLTMRVDIVCDVYS